MSNYKSIYKKVFGKQESCKHDKLWAEDDTIKCLECGVHWIFNFDTEAYEKDYGMEIEIR